MTTFSFFIPGDVPGKKNSKMMTRGRLITDPQIQKQLKDLTMLAQSRWQRRPPLTNVDVDLRFHVSSRRKDLDNVTASVMDCLKDAGVIVNDSMAHVGKISASFQVVPRLEEGVSVQLSGEESK